MGRYAGVIARYGHAIVLVRERYERWDQPYWSLPSGAVEDGEAPTVGASRELAEETGLIVAADALLQISRVTVTDGTTTTSQAWNFAAEVQADELHPLDPDGSILEARWFSHDEAVHLLERHPYPPIREPAVRYLREEASANAAWTFVWHDDRQPPSQFSWTEPTQDEADP